MDLKALAGKPFVRRFVLWPAVAIAVYAVVGFLILPAVVRPILVKRLSEKVRRPVAIKAIRINPFALSARVLGFSMEDRGNAGPFISFEELYLNLEAASLIRRGPVLREILLRSPRATLIRNEDRTYNFSDLLPPPAGKPPEGEKPFRYSLNNIRIVGGNLDIDDRPENTRHTVRDLSVAIPFLSNLPHTVHIFVHPSFEAKINETAVTIEGKTRPFSPSRETTVDLDVSDFRIPHYLEYIPGERKFHVPSGTVDLKTVLSFSQPPGESPAVVLSGNVTLKDLFITDDKDAPMLRLGSLSAGIRSLEPLAGRAKLDNVVITSPEVFLVRGKTGDLNVLVLRLKQEGDGEETEKEQPFVVEIDDLRLSGGNVSYSDKWVARPFQAAAGLDLSTRFRSVVGKVEKETVLSGLEVQVTSLRLRREGEKEDFLAVPEISVTGTDIDIVNRTAAIGHATTREGVVHVTREKDGRIDLMNLFSPPGDDTAPPSSPSPSEKGQPPEWMVKIVKAALSDYSLTAVDRTPEGPVTGKITRLNVTAENLSTETDRRGRVTLATVLNKAGKVSVDGSLGLNPLSGELKVDAKAIDLAPFQPYVADRINIVLTDGKASTRGTLALSSRGSAVRTTYAGEVLVSNLGTVDKATSEEFLSWKSLHLDGIRVGTAPLSVGIREVALTDFYSRIIVTPEGTLNVQEIVRKEEPAKEAATTAGAQDNVAATAAEPAEPAGPPTPVSIGTVTLQGGKIRFTDHFIKPNYQATLLEVGGRVSGLSSEETKMADVDLRGKLENYAPLEITGKINPLRNDLFVDLKVDFKDMDLSPLTPYAGRYAGYTIEKGKLSLSLQYLIEKRKLDASNNVFLDQFTFGDPVESPDATKLPVRLAVSLLKDRSGEIRLDLPVSGSLDDPQFSLGRVILKIIVNLLVKAATSPFALLGAIAGGGEELSFVEFDYGMDAPGDPGKNKLDTIARALHDRPSLKMEIAGYVDPEKDREALRQSMFDRKVRSQKLKDLVGKGGQPPSLDNVVVDAKEYPEYLKRAYRAEKFPKPRNIIGMLKDLPVPEMEKLMFTYIQVTDDDLRLLAQRRAQAVKDALVATNQVEPERIFLLESKTLAPEKKEKQRDSRVEFVLK